MWSLTSKNVAFIETRTFPQAKNPGVILCPIFHPHHDGLESSFKAPAQDLGTSTAFLPSSRALPWPPRPTWCGSSHPSSFLTHYCPSSASSDHTGLLAVPHIWQPHAHSGPIHLLFLHFLPVSVQILSLQRGLLQPLHIKISPSTLVLSIPSSSSFS